MSRIAVEPPDVVIWQKQAKGVSGRLEYDYSASGLDATGEGPGRAGRGSWSIA